MAATLSPSGLSFISSWSLYSLTPYNVVQNYLENSYYIGYHYYGRALSSIPYYSVDKNTTWTQETALEVLRQELEGPCVDLLKLFDLFRFSQNQLDALVSILTTFRDIRYKELFQETKLYKALCDNKSDAEIANIIEFETPFTDYVKSNPKEFNVFYDTQVRRTNEALLFLNGTYDMCPGLNVNTEVIEGIKIFS